MFRHWEFSFIAFRWILLLLLLALLYYFWWMVVVVVSSFISLCFSTAFHFTFALILFIVGARFLYDDAYIWCLAISRTNELDFLILVVIRFSPEKPEKPNCQKTKMHVIKPRDSILMLLLLLLMMIFFCSC